MDCRQTWCPACYKYNSKPKFWILEPQDADGEVWYAKPKDKDRYMTARKGDNLLVGFQCDLCIFRIVTGRLEPTNSEEDQFIMAGIRRISLDAFWAREPSTAISMSNGVTNIIEEALKRGIKPPIPQRNPLPREDVFGYGTALMMIWKSLEAGNYATDHQQFESIRKTRVYCSNLWDAMAAESVGGATIGLVSEDKRKMSELTTSPMQSRWFRRFIRGCRGRMGQDVRPDLAISIDVMHKLMNYCENELATAKDQEEFELCISVGAYFVLGFVCSLRGPEGFMLDLSELLDNIQFGKEDAESHVVAPLLGRFKNEQGERCHMLPMASRTQSGLNPREWLERLALMNQEKDRRNGPAFADKAGNVAKASSYEMKFHEALLHIQENHPRLIPPTVDVVEEYGIDRSLRRGSLTHARNMGVSGSDLDLINRWRLVEKAQGRKPAMRMRDHYSDIRLLVPSLIRYSKAL
jgi:DNA-binding XRE family transcriptional regulator